MKKITVLGSGMVGRIIALDLSNSYLVTVVDYNKNNLGLITDDKVQKVILDLSDQNNIEKVIVDADLVVGALPGYMGWDSLKTVIQSGKNTVDISFLPEDAMKLDDLARKHRITAIYDCGVAPGMSNVILGYHNRLMEIESFECLVGGLPFDRKLPFQYKAPFSPIDVIEEYTRPARFKEKGSIVVKPALSGPEFVDFSGIGTLESFNTDGLRSLLKTMDIPNMKEKTLRYPGHIGYMRMLKDSGFLSEKEIRVKNVKIRPRDLTSELLFPLWKLEEKEPEFTVMRIVIKGKEQQKKIKIVYDLFDVYDEKTGFSSMSRTTGFACTAAVNLLIQGKFKSKGVFPPEYLGQKEGCFEQMISYQKARNVLYKMKVEKEN